jgi:hypothetical protein
VSEHGEKGSRRWSSRVRATGTTVTIQEEGDTATVTCEHGSVAPNPTTWSKSFAIARRANQWCRECLTVADAPKPEKSDEEKQAWKSEMDTAAAAKRQAEAEAAAVAARTELEGMAERQSEAAKKYDKLLAEAVALPDTATKEQVRQAFAKADQAQAAVLGLGRRRRELEAQVQRVH